MAYTAKGPCGAAGSSPNCRATWVASWSPRWTIPACNSIASKLAYGWFALPKLLKELDSDVRLTHWKAVVSLTEFLLNPLNAQRAITEMDIVRKWVSNSLIFHQSIKFPLFNRLKNAFMRMRLKLHKEEHREGEMYLKIYSNLSVLYKFLGNIKD